jgi:hypothetical protein
MKLLPHADLRPADSWELDNEVMASVLTHFYPPTENTDLRKNRIEEQSLQARVESIEKGVMRARLDGKLRMQHSFYHNEDNNFVEASLVGYLEVDIGQKAIRSLQLVTDRARYGGDVNSVQPFGVTVRAVPPGP